MTTIQTQRMGWTNGKTTKLIIMLGEQHAWLIRKLLMKQPSLAFYHFAFAFENTAESGIHRHITEIELAADVYDSYLEAYLTPTAARIDISLDDYDRLRRTGERGGFSFPEYAKLESD
jgi:hypothetical protein